MILNHYLARHAADVADPARIAYTVIALEKFIAAETKAARVAGMLTADQLDRAFVTNYSKFRFATGIAIGTVQRELASLRAAVAFAAEDGLLAVKPYVPKLQIDPRKVRARTPVVYSLPQLAAILEAAWAEPRRHHIHLFVVTMLATHGRTEAILECDLDTQYQHGVIDWLGPDRGQTKKRRSMVPVGPTLERWLEGRTGKLIRFQAAKAERNWADAGVPDFLERDTFDIHNAFEGVLLAAGAAHPTLKLHRPVIGADGNQATRIYKRREGGKWVAGDAVPLWSGVGYPNAIRHTIQTQLRRIGVPDAQIDAAAGHSARGTGRHYTHLDATRDLKDFTAGVEQLFDELKRYTTVHLRTHIAPNVIDIGAARAGKEA